MKRNNDDNLYLIEFYTTNPKTGEGGWDINFAWVRARDQWHAHRQLKLHQSTRFDCVIQTTQQSEIVPLAGDFRANTVHANLFFYL